MKNYRLLKSLLGLGLSKQQIREADFQEVDFREADFREADFREADFRGARFHSANFREADFREANFREADFREADFREANFRGADFEYGYFRGAAFQRTDFQEVNFYLANFQGANFYSAHFYSANFRKVNFYEAGFHSAAFNKADFREANFKETNLNYRINESTFGLTINCPEEGSFIAWKKCQGILIKLLIPEDAKRSSATTYKCRASKALVLDIENGKNEIRSDYDSSFLYRKGEYVEVTNFNENRWNECSTGIHFFMNKEMARNY